MAWHERACESPPFQKIVMGDGKSIVRNCAVPHRMPAGNDEEGAMSNISRTSVGHGVVRTSPPHVVLAVDPSLRGTGYAVLAAASGSTSRVLTYGVISNPARLSHADCLLAIHDTLDGLIAAHKPDIMAVEAVIYVQSFQTAIVLGSARGAVLLAAARRGLDVREYAPRRVKQAVVGRGGAQKQQVGFMVRALLGLTETPPPDAADAIAVGLTHLQNHKTAPPSLRSRGNICQSNKMLEK